MRTPMRLFHHRTQHTQFEVPHRDDVIDAKYAVRELSERRAYKH